MIKKTFIHKERKIFVGFNVSKIASKNKEFKYFTYPVESEIPITIYGEETTIEDLCDYMVNVGKYITKTKFDNIVKDWKLVKINIEILD